MTYGKFTSAEELLKAYGELEKSFTQKCQQLAALKNEMAQSSAPASESENTAAWETEKFFDSIKNDEQTTPKDEQSISVAEQSEQTDGTSATPPSDEEQPTTEFAVQRQNGDDATVLNSSNPLPVKPTDEQLQQYLKDNPKIVWKLLQQEREFAPTVMSGGGNVSLAMPSRPKTIKEASLMAKNLFD